MKDISVELCHIYTNSMVEQEHELSKLIALPMLEGYENSNTSFSIAILIDDYSFPDPSFDYNAFHKWLDLDKYSVRTCRESQLIPYCDNMLKLLPENERKRLIDYIRVKKKYPCSLFIATWYLIRLGKIPSVLIPKEDTASKLLNVLPESFKEFEDEGIRLIATTKYSKAAKDILNLYIQGRKI